MTSILKLDDNHVKFTKFQMELEVYGRRFSRKTNGFLNQQQFHQLAGTLVHVCSGEFVCTTQADREYFRGVIQAAYTTALKPGVPDELDELAPVFVEFTLPPEYVKYKGTLNLDETIRLAQKPTPGQNFIHIEKTDGTKPTAAEWPMGTMFNLGDRLHVYRSGSYDPATGKLTITPLLRTTQEQGDKLTFDGVKMRGQILNELTERFTQSNDEFLRAEFIIYEDV